MDKIKVPQDDEPQSWMQLAMACLADMERYANDETPHRIMVSVREYSKRATLLIKAGR